jgi:hypothetical protein
MDVDPSYFTWSGDGGSSGSLSPQDVLVRDFTSESGMIMVGVIEGFQAGGAPYE